MFRKTYLILIAILFVFGCSDDKEEEGIVEPAVKMAVGQFKDSNTSGLNYISSGQAGVTGPQGYFTYEVGQGVTFSVGGVVLGQCAGKSVVTPIDLVDGGSSATVAVQNMVRFLMMLDQDGIPENGIDISEEIQLASTDWAAVNFSAPDFPAELAVIIAGAIAADQGAHILPDANSAREHLEATMRCSIGGAFKGTFTGDTSGDFGFLVDTITGHVTGVAYADGSGEPMYLSGGTPISYDQNTAFVSGEVDSGESTFQGHFNSVDNLSGSWESGLEGGTFNGDRIGGSATAKYRITGKFSGADIGLFAFDVDLQNELTGIAYVIVDDNLLDVSGSLTGTSLVAAAANGVQIRGTFDSSTGDLTGSWWDPSDGSSGIFDGCGCGLN